MLEAEPSVGLLSLTLILHALKESHVLHVSVVMSQLWPSKCDIACIGREMHLTFAIFIN